MAEYNFSPENIWNMDETGFSTVPTKAGKVISLKGVKKVGTATPQERGTLVTMALAVNAMGNVITPFFVFPRKKMRSHYMDHAPIGSKGVSNESGWMQGNEFVEYMKHFINLTKATKEKPTLLILDNHSSHLSIEALDMAADHGIVMLSFPPHCSHRMQPLDVSVYGPVKTYYKSQFAMWSQNNSGKVFEIHHIPELVDRVLRLALTTGNVMAGFSATGIYPLNVDIFQEQDFLAAEFSGERQSLAEYEAQFDEDDQRIIVFTEPPSAHEEVTTSEPASSIIASETPSRPQSSLSRASSMSRASSLASTLDEIGPVQRVEPRKKSNRGPKPKKSALLTSAEYRDDIRKKTQQAAIRKEKRKAGSSRGRSGGRRGSGRPKDAPKKRQKKQVSSNSESTEEEDFCIICMKPMPAKLTRLNSIECHSCKRPVHLLCAPLTGDRYYCKNCESELSDED